ncbi:hypothetical protein [Microbacterium sp. NPDC056569]|uniref:hypothetical protein n=1 Tax=Microbacterium sp. NPDC056569 TaxID=3345867 RepID=UPI00366BDEF2
MMDSLPAGTASLEALIVDSLPAHDRRLLGAAAVLRYITPELARLATGSEEAADRLADHPLVHVRPGPSDSQRWTMSESLRRELVRSEEAEAASAWRRVSSSDDELESIYAQLCVDSMRPEGFARLEDLFTSAIDSRQPAIGRAHDLLSLLEEWPVRDYPDAVDLHKRLTPRLRRQSRAIRDREASDGYVERDFEQDALDRLLDDDAPWVLHLHAPGGGGKSMFVKNLLGRTCPVRDIPVARIDFDHIDRLGINTTQPWRLLLTLARELNSQLAGQPFEYLLASYGHLRAATFAEAVPLREISGPTDGTATDVEFLEQVAADVPRKFRTELAGAVADGIVVIALDTIENVQHADGASVDAVLKVLREVRDRGASDADPGVPGLRVVLTGRFDLDSSLPHKDGSVLRSEVFHDEFMGPNPLLEDAAGTGMLVGQQALTIAVPRFSGEEARRYLAGSAEADVIDAVVRRSEGNPMKLGLFKEVLKDNPQSTADGIDALESVELAYLVTRIVDRIADPLVQWILRWGALMKILTREAVDQIIWPALEQLIADGERYDRAPADTSAMPPVTSGTERWPLPDAAVVRRAGAADEAWNKLLQYVGTTSWVSTLEHVPDAVQFHPEVREPLRNLLLAAGDPVFDDIHSRALEYWRRKVDDSAPGPSRAGALRCVVFHAYESPRADVSGDQQWRELLADPDLTRSDRGEISDEVIAVALRRENSPRRSPEPTVLGYAHLERAEALIHDAAASERPIDEARLSVHRSRIPEAVRTAEPRRMAFLDAAMAWALSDIEDAWRMLGAALSMPAPRGAAGPAHLELMVEWVHRLEPPRTALDVARRFADAAAGSDWEAQAAEPLARVLIATEQWREALQVATRADDPQLIGLALLGLCRVRDVLESPRFSAAMRAAAALIDLDAARALKELEGAFPTFRSGAPAPEVSLLRGKAHTLRRANDPARAALSDAASGADAGVALEASLWLSRLMAATGHHDLSTANLSRSLHGGDAVARSRAEALEAVVDREADPHRSHEEISEAYDGLAASEWTPPSVRVEMECARLSVLGATPDGLARLAETLESVDDPASRLRALQWLGQVPAAAEPAPAQIAQRLRDATDIDVASGIPAALLLAKAELERVLGYPDASAELLRALEHANVEDRETLTVTVQDAKHRLAEEATGWNSFTGAAGEMAPSDDLESDAQAQMVQISTVPGDGTLLVETESGARMDGRSQAVIREMIAEGHYALAAAPVAVMETLGAALSVGEVARWLDEAAEPVLALRIHDEAAARWPWELASIGDRPLASRHGAAVVRTGRRASLSPREATIHSSEVYVANLNERKLRSYSAGALSEYYGYSARHADPYGIAQGELTRFSPSARIIHLVAEPIERRRAPALQLGGDHLTPERLANAIGHSRSALVILDLALGDSSSVAAEQLMLANAFCWHLVRNAPDVSAICGSFSVSPDSSGRLQRLVEGLRRGLPLAQVVGSLQRQQRPDADLHAVVSLNSEAFRRRFVLEEV